MQKMFLGSADTLGFIYLVRLQIFLQINISYLLHAHVRMRIRE